MSNLTIAHIIVAVLPLWITACYYNRDKDCPDRLLDSIFSGMMLWLLFGGLIAIDIIMKGQ